jgi:hypothetical protein
MGADHFFDIQHHGHRPLIAQQQAAQVSAPNGCFISLVQNRFQQTIGGQKDLGTGIRSAAGVNKAHLLIEIADDLDGNRIDFRIGMGEAHQSHNGAGIDFGIGKDAIGDVIQELNLADFTQDLQRLRLGILDFVVDEIAHLYRLGIGSDENILVRGFSRPFDGANYLWRVLSWREGGFWMVAIIGDFLGH